MIGRRTSTMLAIAVAAAAAAVVPLHGAARLSVPVRIPGPPTKADRARIAAAAAKCERKAARRRAGGAK